MTMHAMLTNPACMLVLQPVYFALLGFHVFGLGFVTSMVSIGI
jgi:uncharacterized membrane protein